MAHVIRHETDGESFSIYNGDTCEVLPDLPKESVGISVYSPPFADLYRYTSSDRDLGNCRTYEEFLEHYRFVVEQMYRLTQPGRMTAVHCMDLGNNGKSGIRDFPGDIIRLHLSIGWDYWDRKTVWKEPWRVALRTRALSLRHSQVVKDASWCRSALPDYVLVFRKPGEAEIPIEHLDGFSTYPGTLPIFPPDPGWEDEWRAIQEQYAGWEGDQKENKLSHTIWRRLASPLWDDVRIDRVVPFNESKDEEAEKHVCPLQLDVIERALMLWSVPSDTCLTPFLGVGSEVYQALLMGRKGIGVELKPSYFEQAHRNVVAATKEWRAGSNQISLF